MKSLPVTLTEEVNRLFNLSIRDLKREIINNEDLWIGYCPLASGGYQNKIYAFIIKCTENAQNEICKLYKLYLHDKSESNRWALFEALKNVMLHILGYEVTKNSLKAAALVATTNYFATYAIKKALEGICEEEPPTKKS